VLLVRPQDAPPQPPLTGDFRRVLIPLDGSALAGQILEPALALGGAAGLEYLLACVIRPLVIGYAAPEMPLVPAFELSVVNELRTLHSEEKTQAQTYLDGLVEELRGRSLRVRTCVAVHDQPAVAILDKAKAEGADLIALATHGRTGLPRLFLGSVADKVLRGASQPVLIQHPTPTP
jgi:nucleotide-binding universal stress UspA family protein